MYNYQEQKSTIFTERGAKMLLEMRDKIKSALENSGAFQMGKVLVSGDTWQMMAVVDYLVEIGELKEITQNDCAGQHRVFVKR